MGVNEQISALKEQLRELKKKERDLSIQISTNKKDQQYCVKELWHLEHDIKIGDKVSFRTEENPRDIYTGFIVRLDIDRANNIYPVVTLCKRNGTAGTRERIVELKEQKFLKKVVK